MINEELLNSAGVDYRAGLARFMGDSELYEMVLCAYVSDDLPRRARAAYDAGDYAALQKIVHEAKGSSGNADLTNVYTEASALVALLRAQHYTKDELHDGFLRFERAYLSMQEAIKAALEG